MTSLRASHDACVGYGDVRTSQSRDALSLGYEIEGQYLDSVVEDILFDEAIEVSSRRNCFVFISGNNIQRTIQLLSLCG